MPATGPSFAPVFIGQELIDDADLNRVAPVAIEAGPAPAAAFLTYNIPYELPSVTYAETHNAWVTGISPRYGTVEGGTDVVFDLGLSGGFVVPTSTVSVFIDDVACTNPVWSQASPSAPAKI